jgi:hypothetical protein
MDRCVREQDYRRRDQIELEKRERRENNIISGLKIIRDNRIWYICLAGMSKAAFGPLTAVKRLFGGTNSRMGFSRSSKPVKTAFQKRLFQNPIPVWGLPGRQRVPADRVIDFNGPSQRVLTPCSLPVLFSKKMSSLESSKLCSWAKFWNS